MVVLFREPKLPWRDKLAKTIESLQMGAVVVNADVEAKSAIVYRDDAPPTTFTKDQDLLVPDILPGFSVNVGSIIE
jgi:Uma2 family endonuclease